MKTRKKPLVGTSFQCPVDLKAWVDQLAESNTRSTSQQIVHILAEKRGQNDAAKAREEA